MKNLLVPDPKPTAITAESADAVWRATLRDPAPVPVALETTGDGWAWMWDVQPWEHAG